MNQFSENLPTGVIWLFDWLNKQPVFLGLLILMFVDIVAGICLSLVKKTLSSACSFSGMCKKAIVLLIVGTSAVLQNFIPAVPLLNIVSTFYVITEAISILEIAASAGVPLPPGLVDTLSKIREQQRISADQKSLRGPINNISIITPAPPDEPTKL